MIVSHRLKFAFFRPPKTGSTTAEFMLRLSGAFDENDIATSMPVGQFPTTSMPNIFESQRRDRDAPMYLLKHAHMTPQDVFDAGYMTMEQFREYDCYAFLRNPRERHLSGVIHGLGRHSHPDAVHKTLDKNLPSKLHPKVKSTLHLLTIPEADYFYVNGEIVVEALDFSRFQEELRRIIARVGGADFPLIPRMNARGNWKELWTAEDFWTPEYIERFEDKYSEDLRLWNALDNWPPPPNPSHELWKGRLVE